MDNSTETRRIFLLAAVAAGLSFLGYLIASQVTYAIGYPLDDAWIHQAYAKNLGLRGEWAFIAGQPSAGSTAPLWAALLAIGYFLRIPFLIWSSLLGWLTLTILGYVGYLALRVYLPVRTDLARWVILFLVLEWHLVWAAASGMETLLAGVLILWFFYKLATQNIHWLALGGMLGVGIWIRPDLITLLGPVGFVAMIRLLQPRKLATVKPQSVPWALAQVGIGFLLLFLPYLLFNRILAGAIWPNTFYAKQAEYAVLREASYISRYLSQISLPLVGVGVVLLPGVILFIQRNLAARRWENLAGPIWWFAYLAIYAWRLPVTYQHGRYLMPAMPVFYVWGLTGLLLWVRKDETVSWKRIVGRTWALVAAMVLSLFWLLGAQAFARDVAFIESEMVAVSNWIREETPPNALIAAHDIGALGYFGGRDLIDMAGLISPEVIPFIQDEAQLARHLDDKKVDYLVTFPWWYPDLVAGRPLIFQVEGTTKSALRGGNMAVYRWNP